MRWQQRSGWEGESMHVGSELEFGQMGGRCGEDNATLIVVAVVVNLLICIYNVCVGSS